MTAPPKPDASTTRPRAAPVAPLTGLPDPTGAAQHRPVLSVKVENTPEARPQAGLEAADVVWDEVVEGQITRLLAMFQSTSTATVGPIRSVRLTDPLIVWPVGGIFAFSGGARYALNAIEDAPVTLVDENKAGPAMFRDRTRAAPHNLFGKPDALWAIGGTPVPPPPLFSYLGQGKTPLGTPTAAVSIGYHGAYAVTYTWDAPSGTWLRSTAGRPFVARSGARIAPANVVVLPVTYQGGLGQIGAEAQLVGPGAGHGAAGRHVDDGHLGAVGHDEADAAARRGGDADPTGPRHDVGRAPRRLVPGRGHARGAAREHPVTSSGRGIACEAPEMRPVGSGHV